MNTGVYHALDSVLCVVLLWPSMVLYWRGIWDLWGYYTDDKHWVMFAIGWISVLGYFIQPVIERYIPRENRVLYQTLIRVYLYCYSAFLMCFWRGVWEVADHYGGFGLQNNLIVYFVCYSIVVVSRSGRTCIFPPMVTVDDMSEEVLRPCTRFGQQPAVSVLYVLDSLYSHILLFLSIITWRSMWNIIICFMYDDPFKTDVTCLVIGLCTITAFYALEEPLAALDLLAHDKGGWWLKLAYEDAVYVTLMWCLCFAWIGGWNLVAAYCWPSIPDGAWGCHVIGLVLLLSLQQFGYVSMCGCAVDGADLGRDAIFPTLFLRKYVLPKKMAEFKLAEAEQQGHDNVVVVTNVENLNSTTVQHVYDNLAITTDLGKSINANLSNGTADSNNYKDYCQETSVLPQ